ncbi:MAG: DUF6328 family protein [Candidatus Nanopelagicales bacterium]
MPSPEAGPPTGPLRDETPAERSDRNWSELLQELRVTQTGVQILTGFLLTVPFQGRFADLDTYQVRLYLAILLLALLTTGLIVAPVALHRSVFGRNLKGPLVADADRLDRVGLATLALVLAGTATLIVDFLVSRPAGSTAGLSVLAVLVGLWLVLPARLAGRSDVAPRRREN